MSWEEPDNEVGGVSGYQVIINGTDNQCGNCSGFNMTVSSDATKVSCSDWHAKGQICKVAVQTISGDCRFRSHPEERSVLLAGI